jgi:uncharacterized membrane protein YfcA
MNFSEVILFVALGAVVGFARGLFAIGGALIAIPLLICVQFVKFYTENT